MSKYGKFISISNEAAELREKIVEDIEKLTEMTNIDWGLVTADRFKALIFRTAFLSSVGAYAIAAAVMAGKKLYDKRQTNQKPKE